MRSQIDFVISEIPPDANEIWLAVNEKCLVSEVCEPLEKFVETHYTVVRDERFYLERLRLLRKKP
jgi:hypothetical protein